MDPFFMYVSIGALVLLILILTVIGVSLTQLQSLDSFPPTQNACPDYWDVSSNPAYCGVPVNQNMNNNGHIELLDGKVDKTKKENIGLCTETRKNFGCSGDTSKTYLNLESAPNGKYQYMQLTNNKNWGKLYPGLTERCAQKSWAQTMNITWDGVTNYNGC